MAYRRTDVGGGAVKNSESHHLARIPLRWMVRECFECKTGIIFDVRKLQNAGLPVTKKDNCSPELLPLYPWDPDKECLSELKPKDFVFPEPPKNWKDYSGWQVFSEILTLPFRSVGQWFYNREDGRPSKLATGCNKVEDKRPLAKAPDELKHDLHDITCDQHDELANHAMWLLMETIPMHLKKHVPMKADGTFITDVATGTNMQDYASEW